MNNCIEWTTEDAEGNEITIEIPAVFEVCSRCEGHGTHLHPDIGSHAYTMEEFNESFDDDESREAYFTRGGMYDVTCEECGGKRVVLVPDWEAKWPGDSKESYRQHLKQEADFAAECAAERRAGA